MPKRCSCKANAIDDGVKCFAGFNSSQVFCICTQKHSGTKTGLQQETGVVPICETRCLFFIFG